MLERFNANDFGEDIDSLNQVVAGININELSDNELRGLCARLVQFHGKFLAQHQA